MARRVGDAATLAYVLSGKPLTLSGPEDLEERVAVAAELMQLAEHVGDREMAMWGHRWHIGNCLSAGDIPTMNREIEAFGRHAEQLRQPYFIWQHATLRVMQAALQGRLDDYERLAEEALRRGRRAVEQDAVVVFVGQMILLYSWRGRFQEVEAYLRDFVDQGMFLPECRCVLAHIHAEVGRHAEARAELEELARNDFSALPRHDQWLPNIAVLARACALTHHEPHATRLYELMKPYGRRVITAGHGVLCFGSASHCLGLLAVTIGAWEEAAQHFEDALEMHTKMAAVPYVADSQHEYATMLLARSDPGDRERALELLGRALDTARLLGMNQLIDKVLALKTEAEAIPGANAKLAEPEAVAVVALGRCAQPQEVPGDMRAGGAKIIRLRTWPAPRAGRVEEVEPGPAGPQRGSRAARRCGAADVGFAEEMGLFRKEGEYWTIAYEGGKCRLKDVMGLRYLAQLLLCPGREFIASDLVAAAHGVHNTPSGAGGARRGNGIAPSASPGDAGEILDENAKVAYRRRLEDLRQELEEARAFNDVGRANGIQAEIEFLTRELARALGLGGRNRRAGSPLERARQSVTRRVKSAIRKITENNQDLGRHLATTVKTGTFCSYMPDPRIPVSWRF
jgi:tetratricopeptide (TPR) repeat protein